MFQSGIEESYRPERSEGSGLFGFASERRHGDRRQCGLERQHAWKRPMMSLL